MNTTRSGALSLSPRTKMLIQHEDMMSNRLKNCGTKSARPLGIQDEFCSVELKKAQLKKGWLGFKHCAANS